MSQGFPGNFPNVARLQALAGGNQYGGQPVNPFAGGMPAAPNLQGFRQAPVFNPQIAGQAPVQQRVFPSGPQFTPMTNVPHPPGAILPAMPQQRVLPTGPQTTPMTNVPRAPTAILPPMVQQRTVAPPAAMPVGAGPMAPSGILPPVQQPPQLFQPQAPPPIPTTAFGGGAAAPQQRVFGAPPSIQAGAFR